MLYREFEWLRNYVYYECTFQRIIIQLQIWLEVGLFLSALHKWTNLHNKNFDR